MFCKFSECFCKYSDGDYQSRSKLGAICKTGWLPPSPATAIAPSPGIRASRVRLKCPARLLLFRNPHASHRLAALSHRAMLSRQRRPVGPQATTSGRRPGEAVARAGGFATVFSFLNSALRWGNRPLFRYFRGCSSLVHRPSERRAALIADAHGRSRSIAGTWRARWPINGYREGMTFAVGRPWLRDARQH